MKKFAQYFVVFAALSVPAVALASSCPCGPTCGCGSECPCAGCQHNHK